MCGKALPFRLGASLKNARMARPPHHASIFNSYASGRPSAHQAAKPFSYYRLIGYQTSLRNDDDVVADVVAAVRGIKAFNTGIVQQFHVRTDASVLVDDCAPHDRALANADPRPLRFAIPEHVFQSLVVVGAHHIRTVKMRAFTDAAAQSDHAAINFRAVDDAAIADD